SPEASSPTSASTSPSTSARSSNQARALALGIRSPPPTPGPTGPSGGGPRAWTPRQCPGRSAAAPNRTTSTREGGRLRAFCAASAPRPSRTRDQGPCTPAGRADAYKLLPRVPPSGMSGLRARQLALTAVAAGLVIAAEGLATLSAASPHTHQ